MRAIATAHSDGTTLQGLLVMEDIAPKRSQLPPRCQGATGGLFLAATPPTSPLPVASRPAPAAARTGSVRNGQEVASAGARQDARRHAAQPNGPGVPRRIPAASRAGVRSERTPARTRGGSLAPRPGD